MASIRITTLLLTLAAYCLQMTAGAPHKRDISAPTATMKSLLADSDYTCTPLLHDYCKSFSSTGERTAGFPNPRQANNPDLMSEGETYYSQAAKEFSEFSVLLNTQCSDKLGTLLCFFYFPFCMVGNDDTTRPCLSLCEEVTDADSECTQTLADYGYNWGPHFDCENYEYNGHKVYTEKNCANDTQMPWPFVPKIEEATTTEATTTEATTTTEIEVITTTPTPTEDTCSPCTEPETCPKKCNTRTGANGKTFVRNDYTFTVRATLNSITTYKCKDALNFTIVEQFMNLKSGDNCSLAPSIGAVGSTFMALGEYSSCDMACFSTGKLSGLEIDSEKPLKDYLVAGHYRKVEEGSCDTVFWELLSGDSLIADWEDKSLSSVKINKYIDARNC